MFISYTIFLNVFNLKFSMCFLKKQLSGDEHFFFLWKHKFRIFELKKIKIIEKVYNYIVFKLQINGVNKLCSVLIISLLDSVPMTIRILAITWHLQLISNNQKINWVNAVLNLLQLSISSLLTPDAILTVRPTFGKTVFLSTYV